MSGVNYENNEVIQKSLFVTLAKTALDSEHQPAGVHNMVEGLLRDSIELSASTEYSMPPSTQGLLASRKLLRKPSGFVDIGTATHQKALSRNNSDMSAGSKAGEASEGGSGDNNYSCTTLQGEWSTPQSGMQGHKYSGDEEQGFTSPGKERVSDSTTRNGRSLGYSVL